MDSVPTPGERTGSTHASPPASPPASPNWVGRRLLVEVGPVAHGGHFIARHEGRVIFVRHTLPGEKVLIEVTEDGGGSFCRADAVEVVTSSPDRVAPACQYSGAAGCGGCDFQHVDLAAQRKLKASVVNEQLARLAGLNMSVEVQPLSGTGLGWRRRIRYAVSAAGRLGLRAHRSHRIIELEACPLGAAGVGDAAALATAWPGVTEVEVAVDDVNEIAVLAMVTPSAQQSPQPDGRRSSRPKNQASSPRRAARAGRPRLVVDQVSGPRRLTYRAAGRTFLTQAGGFWQTNPGAAQTFAETVTTAARPQPAERVLDLYAGAGLFTAVFAEAVGERGVVIGIEADRGAVADAADNLKDLPWAGMRAASVTARSVNAAIQDMGGIDLVILDPPRTGAGREVMTALLSSGARLITYVACDPAALARDIRTALDAGWQLAEVSAFDAFPMTHHVECIAVLTPPRSVGS
ncbi:class I SAM-dependent RNA methyltransferase [Jatrophihabitans sp. DSM 45814]